MRWLIVVDAAVLIVLGGVISGLLGASVLQSSLLGGSLGWLYARLMAGGWK
ncbi:hypothetical protein ACUXAV_000211 [Cupriavidus metallidurans]|jgi:hypothetical protein|uniref:hypothetical protein n=1 Tax=Cupriavidus metallidurans TaxID=119219 RepID=UPI000A4FDB45|nr:hypothetical protein [Cupriavidus metallidurans]MDE4918174.1 hypothetical protein [Cupriavidus metallidurans]